MAHRNAETETESGVRVGPALFITKLMMTYAPFTRYFTRSLNKTDGHNNHAICRSYVHAYTFKPGRQSSLPVYSTGKYR